MTVELRVRVCWIKEVVIERKAARVKHRHYPLKRWPEMNIRAPGLMNYESFNLSHFPYCFSKISQISMNYESYSVSWYLL